MESIVPAAKLQAKSVLDRALELAAKGLPVFPCRAHEQGVKGRPDYRSAKSPRTANGFHDASTDPAVIRLMPWGGDTLIGVPTGGRHQGGCGFDVLDIDGDKDVTDWWHTNKHRIPSRRIQATRRDDGKHVFFKARPGVGCSTGKDEKGKKTGVAPGVDVRGEGGYVIWWGAENRPLLANGEAADWPEWIIPDLNRVAKTKPVDMKNPAAVAAKAPPDAATAAALLNRMHNGLEIARGTYVDVMHAAADCAKITGDPEHLIRTAAVDWAAKYNGDWQAEDSKWTDDWLTHPVKGGWPALRRYGKQLAPGYELELMRANLDAAASEFAAAPLPAPAPPADDGRRSMITPDECNAVTTRPYRVKGLLAAGDVACLFGPPGAGKSLLAPHLAYCIAQGVPFFGRRAKPGLALYVAAEDESGMERRVSALRERHGAAPSFRLVRGISNLNAGSDDLAWLCAKADELRPALIVVDTLAMAFPGTKENDADAMQAIVLVAKRLTAGGAAVLLVHHSSKAQDGTPRGHSLLNGALDMAIMLEPKDDQGVVRGRLTKNRNGSCDMQLGFRIGVATLGVDEDLDAITAAMCEPLAEGDAAAARKPALSAMEGQAIRVLQDMQAANSGVAVSVEAWKQEMMPFSAGKNDRNKGTAISAALRNLSQKGVIASGSGQVWLNGDATACNQPKPLQSLCNQLAINLQSGAMIARQPASNAITPLARLWPSTRHSRLLRSRR